VEAVGTAPKPWSLGHFQFFQLKALLQPDEVQKVLTCVQQSSSYSSCLDSVDEMPTFEYYPFRDGAWVDDDVRAVLEDIIESRVLPYVRERYSCPSCEVADVLVRRYVPGERRTHAVHFDSQAFATAVLGLSDPEQYEGGLYIQPGPHASSRRYPRIGCGDLLVHAYDLQHGVHVHSGVRYSLIMWLKSSREAVVLDTRPWLQNAGALGDPHAFHLLACQAYEQRDLRRAAYLYKRGARAGHHWSQHSLGVLYAEMAEHAQDTATAEVYEQQSLKWWTVSAQRGLAEAQRDLAVLYMEGAVVVHDPALVVVWMQRAAEQLDVLATHGMGELYLDGIGVVADRMSAKKWFERSANAGYAPSVKALRRLRSEEDWLRCQQRWSKRWRRVRRFVSGLLPRLQHLRCS